MISLYTNIMSTHMNNFLNNFLMELVLFNFVMERDYFFLNLSNKENIILKFVYIHLYLSHMRHIKYEVLISILYFYLIFTEIKIQTISLSNKTINRKNKIWLQQFSALWRKG